MANLISPKYDGAKLDMPSTDDLIDVFEDRMKGWFLEPTQKLLAAFNDFPASICLQMTYFEGIWTFITGKDSDGKSASFFKRGFVSVFHGYGQPDDLLERVAQVLYTDARCGFFHDGMFRNRIYFSNRRHALEITLPKRNGVTDPEGEIESIIIDPRQFHATIQKHFTDFVTKLKNKQNAEARRLFHAAFMARQGRSRAIGIPDTDFKIGGNTGQNET
ncbi:MAG: hypothetical protein WC881_02010 [Elusimicrobiota bacterium]|jgi:hypothetical protein